MRHVRSNGVVLLVGAIFGLAVVVGWIVIRAHAPIPEGPVPVRGPARQPAAPPVEGLPAAVGSFVGLGSRDDGKALLRELKITFPAGTIFSADGFHRYGVLGMPTTVFITADGKILRKYTGMLTRDQMNAFVRELLKAPGSS